jgi:hypothetical protein
MNPSKILGLSDGDVINILIFKVEPDPKLGKELKDSAKNGHLEDVNRLLEDPRVDPSAKNNLAIRTAAKNCHSDVVKALKQHIHKYDNISINTYITTNQNHITILKHLNMLTIIIIASFSGLGYIPVTNKLELLQIKANEIATKTNEILLSHVQNQQDNNITSNANINIVMNLTAMTMLIYIPTLMFICLLVSIGLNRLCDNTKLNEYETNNIHVAIGIPVQD